MYEWETISSKIFFKYDRIEVSEDTVRIEDGRILNDYIQIITNDHCVIIPMNEHGQYLLFKQHKYGPRCTSFTFPAGNIANKEEPCSEEGIIRRDRLNIRKMDCSWIVYN